MPIQSGQVGRYGVKATPDILGPHKGIPWRSPALANAMPTINGRTHDSTGVILGNCSVWAMNTQSDTVMGTTTSDANGLFSLTLYTSGSYYLVAYKQVISTTIPSQLSFSRASSGTYFDSTGANQTALSNVARFDYLYNGTSWVAAGLLLEDQSTNLVIQSGDLTNGVWNKNSTTVISGVAGINGITTDAFTVTSGAASSNIYSNCTLVFGLAYTVSFWIRRRTGSGDIRILSVNGNGGTALNLSPSPTPTWQHFVATIPGIGGNYENIATSTTGYVGIEFGTSGDVIDVCFPQAEVGDGYYPSSYIPTTTVAVIRSADLLSSTNATLLAANAWVVEVGEMRASTASTLLGINTTIGLGATTGNALTTADGGAQTTANTGTWSGTNRGGLAFDTTPRVSIDLNGGTVVTAANTPSTVTNLYFGNTNNGASGFLNGHLRMMASYSALTDGQLPDASTVAAALATLNPTFSIQWAGTGADVSGTTVNTLIPT